MNKEELYKASYMQNPFEISEDTLDKLEKHCKKMIHYERGSRENEHSNVLQLIYNYQDMQQELQLKDKMIEMMAEKMAQLQTGLSIVREQFDKEYCDFIKDEEADCCWKTDMECSDCIKEYYEKKVMKEGKR